MIAKNYILYPAHPGMAFLVQPKNEEPG